MEPYTYTISESLEKLEKGDITAVELVSSSLKKIEETDKKLKAFVTVNTENALLEAKKQDDLRKRGEAGKLSGIPVSIKDLISTQGIRTTCGSKMLENYIPPYDATVIEKLKKEGAVIIGKVTMDEFAMGSTSETCAFGVPDNPWKNNYVAGGSSGGSAVSVASGQCLASLGSDTGGSIRQPASLCGIVGMKPTYGRVSRYGLVAFASSLDQIGPLTRDVRDCAVMMNCISGYDKKDSTSVQQETIDFTRCLEKGVKDMTIGVPKEFFKEGIDKDVLKVFENAVAILKDGGAKIVDISLPHNEYCVAAYYIIAPAEASSNLARYDGVVYGFRDTDENVLHEMYTQTRSKGFGDEVKRRILIGTYALSSGYYDAYYKKASQVRTIIRNDFKKAFTSCDVIITPVTPTPAWQKGKNSDNPLALYLSDIFTLSANMAGIPGISVPGGFSSDGLPIGIQFMGPHFKEDLLLKMAYNIEKVTGLANKIAPV